MGIIDLVHTHGQHELAKLVTVAGGAIGLIVRIHRRHEIQRRVNGEPPLIIQAHIAGVQGSVAQAIAMHICECRGQVPEKGHRCPWSQPAAELHDIFDHPSLDGHVDDTLGFSDLQRNKDALLGELSRPLQKFSTAEKDSGCAAF